MRLLKPAFLATMAAVAACAAAHPLDMRASEPADTTEQVYALADVDQQPGYPGGYLSMYGFLYDNLRYSPEAFEAGAQGLVIVRFVIGADGRVVSAEPTISAHELLGAEAVRVIMSMPQWSPAQCGGSAVAVSYTLPIRFRLPAEDEGMTAIAPLSELHWFIPDEEASEVSIYALEQLDTKPCFPDGDDAMYEFLGKNLKWPDYGQLDVQGTVVMTFVVNADGSISDIETTRSPHRKCTEEAERLVRLMPKWTPGTYNGKPVNALYVLPIRFKIAS